MIKIVNLTPHELSIKAEDGDFVVIPPSGQIARRAMKKSDPVFIEVEGGKRIAIRSTIMGEITGLPDPQEGVKFVVSAVVAKDCGRPDVCSPGDLIRGTDGQPVGADGLAIPA